MPSQIRPHIIVEATQIIIVMPFHMEAKEALKKEVPYEERTWDGNRKCWKLSPTKENYNRALKVLKDHFPTFKQKPLVYNKGGDVQATFDMAIDTTSYYSILQIKESATAEEIKKGHRKVIKLLHPDRGGESKHFILVQKAYEVLSNPKKKKRYDLARGVLYNTPIPFSSQPKAAPIPTAPPSPFNVRPNPQFGVGDIVQYIGLDHVVLRYMHHQFTSQDMVELEELPQRETKRNVFVSECSLIGTRAYAQQAGVNVPPPTPPIHQTQPIPPNFGPGDWVLYKGRGPYKIEDMWPDTTGYMCLLGDPKRPNAKRRGYAHDCKKTSRPPQPPYSKPGPRQQAYDAMTNFDQMSDSQQKQIIDMLQSVGSPSSSKPPDALGSISTPRGTKSFNPGDSVQYGKERVTFVDYTDSDKDIARVMNSKGFVQEIDVSFLTPL